MTASGATQTTASRRTTFELPDAARPLRSSMDTAPVTLLGRGGGEQLCVVVEEPDEPLSSQHLLAGNGEHSDHVSHTFRNNMPEGGLGRALRGQSESAAGTSSLARQSKHALEPAGNTNETGAGTGSGEAQAAGRKHRKREHSHKHHHTAVDLELVVAAMQAAPELKRCVCWHLSCDLLLLGSRSCEPAVHASRQSATMRSSLMIFT
jgi:hypothetical protein